MSRVPGNLRWALVGALLAGVSVVPGARAELAFRSEFGFVQRSWEYRTYLGEVKAGQSLVPVRLELTASPWVWNLAFDYVRSDNEDPSGSSELSGPARAGVSLARWFMDERVRLEGGADWILEQGPYDMATRRLIGRVTDPALGLPGNTLGTGHRYRVASQAVLLGRRDLVVLVGGHVEAENAYDLRDDGLGAGPGTRFGFGFGLDQATSLAVFRHRLVWNSSRTDDVDGAPAYDLGSEIRVGSEGLFPFAPGNLSADLGVVLVSSGRLETGSVLDAPAVRGGNRVTWGMGWTRPGIWTWGLRLSGIHHRGFSSALGRSDRFAPGLSLSRNWGGDDLTLELEYVTGAVREGRDITGAGISLAWSREWIR